MADSRYSRGAPAEGRRGRSMKAKLYVETSVLSYLAARPSRDTVTAGRQVITRRWWETEREKYSLVVSEAVEAECERGDPDVVKRRRELLVEVSLFPVDERILELARLLIVPGAIPEKAGPDAVHIAAAAVEECEFLLTWNFRHIANVRDSAGSGKDSGESWLHENDHLHPGRTCVSRGRGKTKCSEKSTRRVTPMRQSTVMIWIGSMLI